VGEIRAPGDDVLVAQHKIYENENKLSLCEYKLERDDIYKELRIMGYDYGPEFRRLLKVGTNDFQEMYAINEWTGNIVTYLDAITQLAILTLPFRKLMVPVMLREIRIDPLVLFDAIKRNPVSEAAPDTRCSSGDDRQSAEVEINAPDTMHQNVDKLTNGLINETGELGEMTGYAFRERFPSHKANMPIYFNGRTKQVVGHGVEIGESIPVLITRRVDTTDLVLDSYEFCPNDDRHAIDKPVAEKTLQYIEVYKL
jgi:hypothetical protein